MRSTTWVVLAALVLAGSTFAFQQRQRASVALGVLEDTAGDDAHSHSEAEHYRSVRVLFFKEDADWQAIPVACTNFQCLHDLTPAVAQGMTWNVVYRGQAVGKVTTPLGDDPPGRFSGQYKVTGAKIPTLGTRSREFAAEEGQPVYRPLIVNSQPASADPDHWQPAVLPAALLSKVRAEFRNRYPQITNCERPETKPYAATQIRPVVAYGSIRKWRVAEIAVKGCAERSEGEEHAESLDKEWFAISSAGEVLYLGREMRLLDAGDYDHDGKSELIFAIDEDERAGYRLFYDDFRKRAVFEFAYD